MLASPSQLQERDPYSDLLRDPVKGYERFPSLRVIPLDSDTSSLVVEHAAYDLGAARRDANVMLPIDRLRELAEEGVAARADS